jgi:hypothetical protein
MEIANLNLIIPDFYVGPLLQAAVNQAATPPLAAVWIPATYPSSDTYTNPSNVPVFDMRGTGSTNLAVAGGTPIVQSPGNTPANTIAPTANNVVGLTVTGTTGTGTPHIQDWNLSGGGAGSAAFLDSSGHFTVALDVTAANGILLAGAGAVQLGTGITKVVTKNAGSTTLYVGMLGGAAGTGNNYTGSATLQGGVSTLAGGTSGNTFVLGGDATGTSTTAAGNLVERAGGVTSASGVPGLIQQVSTFLKQAAEESC